MLEAILQHAAIYPVLIPIVGCLLILLVGHIHRDLLLNLLNAFLILLSLLCVLVAYHLQQEVITNQVVAYYLGGWIPPFGIEVRLDSFSSFTLGSVVLVNFVAVLFSISCCKKELNKHDLVIFWSLWLLAFAGLNGMVITGDLFNLYVFVEISSLATYVLVAGGATRHSLSASFTYLVIGSFGAAFFFTGIVFLYILTGTLNMQDIINVVGHLPPDRTFIAAFCFMAVGLAIKAAIFPVHLWLPNVYAFAPVSFTVLLIGIATKVSLYALFRVMSLLTNVIEINPELTLPLIGFTLVVSSFFACVQCNFRQVLAYSSVAQMSFIIIGFLIANPLTTTAGAAYFYVHALTKITLFISLIVMAPADRLSTLHSLRGAVNRSPAAVAFFLYAAASLIGLPGTPGFWIKWEMLIGISQYEGSKLIVLASIIISTVLAMVYMSRIAWQIFAPAASGVYASQLFQKNHALAILLVLTLVMLYLTFSPQTLLAPARFVADVLVITS